MYPVIGNVILYLTPSLYYSDASTVLPSLAGSWLITLESAATAADEKNLHLSAMIVTIFIVVFNNYLI